MRFCVYRLPIVSISARSPSRAHSQSSFDSNNWPYGAAPYFIQNVGMSSRFLMSVRHLIRKLNNYKQMCEHNWTSLANRIGSIRRLEKCSAIYLLLLLLLSECVVHVASISARSIYFRVDAFCVRDRARSLAARVFS